VKGAGVDNGAGGGGAMGKEGRDGGRFLAG
jgi:hypothetical protein